MSKEYIEALEKMSCATLEEDLSVRDIYENEYDIVKNAIQRLEAIDNSNPSEALECWENMQGRIACYISTIEYTTIKQALLKAEKEHNSVTLLMQELDCKDFAELRKYARCGYEKLNKKDLHLERVEEWQD